MIEQTIGRIDPAFLAGEVRDLAYDARRLLNSPSTEHFELRELSRRISDLQDQIRGQPFHELACWLENVRRRLDEAS
jgi:hypothetical protein